MIIRSILFYILITLWTILLGIVCLPYLFLSDKYLIKPAKLWILGILNLLKATCNITYEVRGSENIPNHAVLIASKHQSAFETLALYLHIDKAVFIHKKQLFYIPIFGQYLKKINMISINRSEGSAAMRKMLREAKEKIALGYSIIIFPEGTRKKPGEKPNYKTGFIGIYNEINSEILPVAVNSGYYWPKQTFIKKSGHIIIQILETIPSGQNKFEVIKKLEFVIENKMKNII